jgi:hypothetical protein
LEWALLVPVDAAKLEARVARFFDEDPAELDRRSWLVRAGTGKHAAVIETEPGSSSTEAELAKVLSKELAVTVWALGFVGYDDPDAGLPYVDRYDGGRRRHVWMAPYDDGEGGEFEEPERAPGPEGVDADDPFALAAALGCELRPYYER